MTTPEAGRMEELARVLYDAHSQWRKPHLKLWDDETDEMIRALYRHMAAAALTTQAETIRRLERDCQCWADDYAESSETIRRLEGMYKAAESLVQRLEANVEAERQRAEAAEGLVKQLLAAGAGAHTCMGPPSCPICSRLQANKSPATGEGEG